MAVSRVKTWVALEILTAADLNAEFNNILNNGESVGFPRTTTADFNGQTLTLDADGDSSIVASTDDRLDMVLQGATLFRFDGSGSSPVNGLDFTASATTVDVVVGAVGTDSNISIDIQPKGTGVLKAGSSQVALIDSSTLYSFMEYG